MAYSFSFDASLKLRGCDIHGFINHFMREDNVKQHSNKSINPNKTKYNRTLVFNESIGKMQLAKDAKQIRKAINTRLSKAINLKTNTYITNGKKVRTDAVQCRGIIVQLDPQFYKDNEGNSDLIIKSFNDMLHLIQNQFGKENIVACSLHLDETNPHMHILFVPITADGRLSQKDFIDKKKLIEAHKTMREELRSLGYDIDLERRTPKGSKRLTEEEYKSLQDSAKQLKTLKQLEINLKTRQEQFDKEKEQLNIEKAAFENYKSSQMQSIQEQTIALDKRETQLKSFTERAYEMFCEAKEFLDKAKRLFETLDKEHKSLYQKPIVELDESLLSYQTQKQHSISL